MQQNNQKIKQILNATIVTGQYTDKQGQNNQQDNNYNPNGQQNQQQNSNGHGQNYGY
jgi:hypothetical protein